MDNHLVDERKLVDEFCMFRGFKDKTFQAYTRSIFSFRDFIKKSLFNADHEDAREFIDTLKAQKKYKDDDGNTKITYVDATDGSKRTTYHQLLSFYNHLVDKAFVNENPFEKVKVPHPARVISDRIPTLEEIEKFLDVIQTEFTLRDYSILLLIASTGLKITDCLKIKWSDFQIDDSAKVALMVNSYGDTRYILILDSVWAVFNRYREEFLNVDESVLTKDAYVFIRTFDVDTYKYNPQSIRKPITIDLVRKLMADGCKLANIDYFSAKDLRHAHVVYASKFGASVDAIKEQLGWRDKSFINRYKGVFASHTASANSYLEEYFQNITTNDDE